MSIQPQLTAAIFMCCFSSSTIEKLIDCAPYLITVFGHANDDAAIEFVRIFYENYFEKESIQQAYYLANFHLGERISTALSRRAIKRTASQVLWQVFPTGYQAGDSILVDLTEAEEDIKRLEVPRETFLSLLTRKIRLHAWIFDHACERVVLPLARYFGIFSWENAADVVKCHRILKPKKNLEQATCDVWTGLIVNYNDDFVSPYRLSPDPAGPHNEHKLKTALCNLRQSYKSLYENEMVVNVFMKHVPEQFKLSMSIMNANLDKAENKLYEGDYRLAVVYLETALSAEHDLVDATTEQLSE